MSGSGRRRSSKWDVDESYDANMSPGFEEWKHKRHSLSPLSAWGRPARSRSRSRSRSQSRSPTRGLRWDTGGNDRNRTRAGGSTQLCRDFAAGSCRRGSRCHFLHHDNQNYEDVWEGRSRKDGAPKYPAPQESRDYPTRSARSTEACINFAKGKCRMGASCKYLHHSDSDVFSKGSADEITREREIDRRRSESSFEWGDGHEPNRSGSIPCKFFAAGNCRNGKYCRFSHDRQAGRSPNRRLREERWGSNPGGDQVLDRSKWSESVSPNGRLIEDRHGSDHNMVDTDKVLDDPNPLSVSDIVKMSEGQSKNMGALESGFGAWPMSEGWGHSLDKNNAHGELKAESGKKEADRWKAESADANMGVSQSIVTDNYVEMSPDWNYGLGSSSQIKEEHGPIKPGPSQNSTYLATSDRDRMQVAPVQGFNQNAQSVNALIPSSVIGQSQVAVPIAPQRGGNVEGLLNQEVSTEEKYGPEPNITDAKSPLVGSRNPSSQNLVSNEQLAQLTNLSASLVHFLGSGQQLPHLYAALNSHDKDGSSLASNEVSGGPALTTFNKSDPSVGFRKPYDPLSDSIESKKAEASGISPALSPRKKIAQGEIEVPSLLTNVGRQNCSESCKTATLEDQNVVKSEQLTRLLPCDDTVIKKDNDSVAEQRPTSPEDCRNTEENGPAQNTDHSGGPDEAKKLKDVKGLRAFKFALVEFVKELLKPAWREGQITKEDYKTIVKKVVDKVTGAMQGAHIPQTQEKIDHYLSFSKPKLNKLVQAYVEKVKKA